MNDIIMYGSALIAVIIVVIMLIKKWILKSHCLPWVLC